MHCLAQRRCRSSLTTRRRSSTTLPRSTTTAICLTKPLWTLLVERATPSTTCPPTSSATKAPSAQRVAGKAGLRVNLDYVLSPTVDMRVSSVYARNENDRGWSNNCNNYGCHGYALTYIPSFVDLTKRNADWHVPGSNCERAVESDPAYRARREPRGDQQVHGRGDDGLDAKHWDWPLFATDRGRRPGRF